ncbi:MAG: hypothetical protein H6661_10265 [Ardenticatenaceae bacterium]|nr:hypothetical protein [Ardenticatenaceae bacterium]
MASKQSSVGAPTARSGAPTQRANTPIEEQTMNVAIGLLGITAVGALLFLTGWLLAVRSAALEALAAYEGGKRAVRAVDLAKLRQLRQMLEEGEEGVLAADACLLFDVCQALQLSDGEAQHILGASYLMVIEAPVLGEGEGEL